MTDKVVVLVTAGSLKEARAIAKALVASRLAACVNISAPVESIYHWQAKIETGRERLLVIKTSREVFPELAAEVRRVHSYAVPEIVCLPIVDGSRDYLDWLSQSLKTAAAPGASGEAPAKA